MMPTLMEKISQPPEIGKIIGIIELFHVNRYLIYALRRLRSAAHAQLI